MARLVTLTDVKAHLNISSSNNDDELTGFLLDAIRVVEDLIGPLTPRSVIDEVPNGPVIVLPQFPAISVTSVSVVPYYGVAAVDDTGAWRLNAASGVLRRQTVGAPLLFLTPDAVVTVTYTVGRNDIPGPVNRAILMQVADMWRTQRGAMPMPANGEPTPAAFTGAGFLSPGVMELLLPYLLPPGVG